MSSERVKNSAKNMINGFLYQAIVLILSFVSRTVFIRTLGAEYLGLNGIFTDVLSLLSMADLGFGTAMAYSFYKPLADHDEDKIAALICFYKKIYNFIAIAVLILGLLCIPFLKYTINTEEEIPYLEIYYLFSLVNVVISYLFVYKTTLLNADQKNYKVVQISMWTSVLKTVLQMIILLLLGNYFLYLAIGVLIQFINNLVASKRAEKEYPFIKNTNGRDDFDGKIKDELFANMKSVFIYKLSSTMFTATDNIIISMVVGTVFVGLYSNYLMVSSRLLLIEQIVFSALTASIGNVIVKENADKRLRVFQSMQSISFIFCGIISSAFCLLANDLILVWLGEEYLLSTMSVIAITLNTYMSCVLQPLWVYRDATGLYRKTKYIMLIGAIINIVLSVILGCVIGVAGIIFASAISRLCTYFWYEPKLLFKEYFNDSAKKYYMDIAKNILLVTITVVVFQKISAVYVVHDWVSLIIKGVVMSLGCCLVFICVYMKTEGFQMILKKIRTMF